MRLILGMQVWFNIQKPIDVIYHINRLKMKTYVIISIDEEKSRQNSTFILDKNSQKKWNTWELPQPDKNIYKKPTANIILNGKKRNGFSLRIRQGCPFSLFLFNILPVNAIKQEKETESIQTINEEI